MTKKARDEEPINNLVIVSDTHGGCQHALCPPETVTLDEGGTYEPSENQRKLWDLWQELWDPDNGWVTQITHGEPFDLVHNAELTDGVHHGSVTQISHNLTVQGRIAAACMRPSMFDLGDHGPLNHPRLRHYYQTRGTEAHSGKSAQQEESLAEMLGAKPRVSGKHKQYARYELWKKVGDGLVHITHHVGVTGSSHYESTAVYKELVEAFVESARWAERPPDICVRSHRHRAIGIVIPADLTTNEAWSLVTPSWQAKTGYIFRTGGRMSPPQFGAVCIRVHADGAIRPAFKTWHAKRPEPEP
jgi:hypothetical protein